MTDEGCIYAGCWTLPEAEAEGAAFEGALQHFVKAMPARPGVAVEASLQKQLEVCSLCQMPPLLCPMAALAGLGISVRVSPIQEKILSSYCQPE